MNRVVLATDGDFNVGVTSQDELVRLIEEERASGLFLSVLGVGTGNLKDSTMEKLADKGNGNRILKHEDFNDDKKDAGEIGSGHSVTALYEIVPAGVAIDLPSVDALKYQTPSQPARLASSDELVTVKLRYKAPDGDTSRLLSRTLRSSAWAVDGKSWICISRRRGRHAAARIEARGQCEFCGRRRARVDVPRSRQRWIPGRVHQAGRTGVEPAWI